MPSRCDSGDSFHPLTSDWHPRLLHAVALRLKGGRRQAGRNCATISEWAASSRPVLVLVLVLEIKTQNSESGNRKPHKIPSNDRHFCDTAPVSNHLPQRQDVALSTSTK